ncbi:glutaredoxin family protein, partial [Mesobacillus sp.]|uniref:glutaredoxin family protein n=1 Tax=Mesobacillus sp. TaxID=2675271 RepID=UPI003C6F366E
AGQVRPRRSEATRRLSASPAESEAPGTKIKSLVNRANIKKNSFKGDSMKKTVKLYSRPRCHLCETAREILEDLQNQWDFTIEEINIDLDDELVEKYGIMIPVVELDGEELQYGIVNKKFISEAFTRKNLEFIS